jgi:polyhydroxybutyrate depolymerase
MKLKSIFTGLLISASLFAFSQTTIIDSIVSDGINRSFRLYVPAAYTGSTARPLLFDFHGYTSNAQQQQFYSNFMPIADTANFLVVYPQGTSIGGQPYWNAGQGGTNDLLFVSSLLDTLKAHYNIDDNSVYSCGMSNGGFMSHSLACTFNDKIAAIASVTGTIFTPQYTSCVPNRAVPVMQIHGTADAVVPYIGQVGVESVETAVNYWVTNNNCNTTPVFTNVPNTSILDACTAEHYVYNGGDNGSTCELYKIIGGGHTWPGALVSIGVTNQDFNASLKIWLFFKKYKLNQLVGIKEQNQENAISIYPNPSQSIIYIKTPEGVDANTQIVDINGKIVVESKERELFVEKLPAGVYSVLIITKTGRTAKRLVKW